MRSGLHEIDWKQAGAEFARSDDKQQIDFFKSFVKECKTWGTEYQINMQLASVNKELTKEEIDCLGMITYKGD